MHTVFTTARNKPIRPRSLNQVKYTQAIEAKDILFAIGPAGHRETYLAMAMAMAPCQRRHPESHTHPSRCRSGRGTGISPRRPN